MLCFSQCKAKCKGALRRLTVWLKTYYVKVVTDYNYISMEIGVSFNVCYKTNFWANFDRDCTVVYSNKVPMKSNTWENKMKLKVIWMLTSVNFRIFFNALELIICIKKNLLSNVISVILKVPNLHYRLVRKKMYIKKFIYYFMCR